MISMIFVLNIMRKKCLQNLKKATFHSTNSIEVKQHFKFCFSFALRFTPSEDGLQPPKQLNPYLFLYIGGISCAKFKISNFIA